MIRADRPYDYDRMNEDIFELKETYPFLDVVSIGQSVLGRELYCLKLGRGKNQVLYNGAHHALEWITSLLLMKFCESYLRAYDQKVRLLGYDIGEMFETSTIYLVPMVNPDGVNLVINGMDRSDPLYETLVSYNQGSPSFAKTWQANIHGADLNHNYDADFHKSRDAEKEHDIFGPNCTRYAGKRPFCEPETRALAQFVSQKTLRLVIAYHTQGKEIYYDFNGKEPKESYEIGTLLARETGYVLAVPEGIASFGGFKDWFIDLYKKPGFTIEAGIGKNPLPLSQFHEIYRDNLPAMLLAAII